MILFPALLRGRGPVWDPLMRKDLPPYYAPVPGANLRVSSRTGMWQRRAGHSTCLDIASDISCAGRARGRDRQRLGMLARSLTQGAITHHPSGEAIPHERSRPRRRHRAVPRVDDLYFSHNTVTSRIFGGGRHCNASYNACLSSV